MNDEPQHKHRKYWRLCIFAVFIAILGIVLPEFEPTPITYINASNITTVGANAVGSLQNITEINNGFYNVSEINAQPYYVIVNFTNITNFSFLEVKAKYFSVSGTPSSHIVDLEIFCEIDQDYEDVFFLENSAEWRYFTRHFPDSMHFIDSHGNVSIKFNHTSNGNVNHRLYIDVVRLIILPQYALNTVTLNQYFNTTTTSGGGGVSFNGSPVNANGSNIYNVTIDGYNISLSLNKTNLSQVLAVGNDAINQNINITNGTLYINNQSVDKMIFHYIVPSNMTWVNVSGLNISRDRFYDVTLQLTCRITVNDLYLFVNNDFNESNYTRQYVLGSGISISAARENKAGVNACDAGYSSVGKQRIILDPYGKVHYMSEAGVMTSTQLFFFNGDYSYDKNLSNLNNLSFKSNVVDGIGYGSEIWIYRS